MLERNQLDIRFLKVRMRGISIFDLTAEQTCYVAGCLLLAAVLN